jgi:hypothetical protein
MSFKSLLPSCLWLSLGALALPGCTPLSPAGASQTWPTHGNQYYNYRNAKYLGSDSAEQLSWRLIDSAAFAGICRDAPDESSAAKTLLDSSIAITIDNTRIQADLQWIKDSSVITGKEYQIYLYIDRRTGLLSSLHGDPGTNHNSHPFIETDRNHGMVSPIPIDSPMNSNRILIGQVHGHPATPEGATFSKMSADDSLTAACLQTPIYAIDAMDGLPGTPGSIHRANPNPGASYPLTPGVLIKSQDLFIGKTTGLLSATESRSTPESQSPTGNQFNIGLNALRIWGITRPPDFKLLSKINSQSPNTASPNTASPNTLASIRR